MSTGPDRDESLDRLLRQSARSVRSPAGPGACPEAEILSAWAEGSLGKSQFATVEAHMAGCARCQDIAAVLAKTMPAAPASGSRWQWGVALRWLAPLAAGATAVALWVAIPDRNGLQSSVDSRQSSVESPQPTVDSRQSAVGSPQSTVEQPQETKTEAAPAVGRLQAPPPADELREADRVADRVAERRDAAPAQAARSAPAAPPAPAAPAAAPERSAEAVSAAVPTAAPATAAAGARNEALTLTRQAAAFAPVVPVVVISPMPSIRWRLGAAGLVEYSSDSGTTWQRLATGVAADLLAGASPSSSVCWVVGRDGTVLLSTDGRRFTRLVFPVRIDLVGVTATGARTAAVTTVDGRTFRTTDAGTTWIQ